MAVRGASNGAGTSRFRRVWGGIRRTIRWLGRAGGWVLRFRTPLALAVSAIIVAGLIRQLRQLRTDSVVVAPTFNAPLARVPIEVPLLERRTIDAARNLAWSNDLVLVEVQVVAPGERRGKILDQFPPPGLLLRPGDALTVTVSMGETAIRLPPDARVDARTPLRLTVMPVDVLQARLDRATARAAARRPTPEGP